MKTQVTKFGLGIFALLVGCAQAEDSTKEGSSAQLASLYQTVVDGAPGEADEVGRDSIELNFAVNAVDGSSPLVRGFECRFGDQQYVPCSGTPFVLSGLLAGQIVELTVRAILQSPDSEGLSYAGEISVRFKVADQLTIGAPSAAILGHDLQVGSFYGVRIPEGMHATEYSTSKTTGVLNYFRIMNESDPYYLGNFACDRAFDRVVGSLSPAGLPTMYCHSTPPRKVYKEENEFRLAHNHLEITTDESLVTAENQERLTYAAFDRDFELTRAHSRFFNACLNSEISHIDVPMIPNFFLGKNPEAVRFYFCDTVMPSMGGAPEVWRVGGFFDDDQYDWDCDDCAYDRGLEAVYMVKANRAVFLPEHFARVAQTRIMDTLYKVMP